MKFKRMLAAVLSVLMLSSMLVFTASAELTYVYKNIADQTQIAAGPWNGQGLKEAPSYDAENGIAYIRYTPDPAQVDWMHIGWPGIKVDIDEPVSIGMLIRTSLPVSPVARVRTPENQWPESTTKVETIGDGSTWETIWLQLEKDGATACTNLQLFLSGFPDASHKSDSYINAGKANEYFDVAAYVFLNGTVDQYKSIDLRDELDVSGNIKIHFDLQNGDAIVDADIVSGSFNAGNFVKFPAEDSFDAPEGKAFAYWATDAEGTEKIDDINAVSAPWTEKTYYAIYKQDEALPGDVTIKTFRINGTTANNFGVSDFTVTEFNPVIPYNWTDDKIPEITVEPTDSTATITVSAGTFGDGSSFVVKNGTATETYTISYTQAEPTTKSFKPTGSVTSNPPNTTAPYKGETYRVTGTRFTACARISNEQIAGEYGSKLVYNKVKETVPGNGVTVDTETKTINGNASFYDIATDAQPAYEGGGAYGHVTLSDYPWMRVKYYLDAGEDGQTFTRHFVAASTSWDNNPGTKGLATSTKKNTALQSEYEMVEGRWAYAYINLAKAFSEDYGYTYQFHYRPFNGDHFKSNVVMQASADDPTKAEPKSGSASAILFDDAFYLAETIISNTFPGNEDGLFEQIAPYVGDFTVTDESEVGANDSKIAGFNSDMEYRAKGEEEWTACTEAELMLNPGTYQVRYAAIEGTEDRIGYAASPVTELTIKAALGAAPNVTAVNATKVGANDGKVTGVDTSMSYRAKGEEEWTAITVDGDLTGLEPGSYELIYLADGELRTEDSDITVVTVLVDFDTEVVFYVTNNADNADTAVYDGSSYNKAYYVGAGGQMSTVVKKYVGENKTVTMVVIDGADLGAWQENIGGGNGSELTITGLTPDAYINFACHNNGQNYAMQNFGNLKKLTFENITLKKACITGEGVSGESGIVVSAMTELVIGENVTAGENAQKIRIYGNNNSKLANTYTLKSGAFEDIFAGVTYTNVSISEGENTMILDGASVNSLSATRHQRAYLGKHNVIINSGEVRTFAAAGTWPGAFGGDSYLEINGGTVAKVYTSARAEEHVWNNNGNKYYTGSGIAAGCSVVVINGGKVGEFLNGKKAPGGTALIVGAGADIPELGGWEADYIIKTADATLIKPIIEEDDYTFISTEKVILSGATEPRITEQKQVPFTAGTITGFELDIPEDCNAVKLNGEVIVLTDGILPVDALSEDVNEITFVQTWNVKADLNGGNSAFNPEDVSEAFENIFEEGLFCESDEIVPFPNADDLVKPYRSGYTLAGWALKADATPEECIEFPYTISGDTTFYAIWVEANDTGLKADENALEDKEYFVYATEADDTYEDFEPFVNPDLGEIEYYGAYSVTVLDASTGEENTERVFSVELDISDIDLEGKILYVENIYGGTYALAECTEDKCVIAEVGSGAIFQVYTLDPLALYTLEGTYYAKRGEYTVDIYLDAPAVNAGSIGLGYTFMTYTDIAATDGIDVIFATDAETANENGFVLLTWGSSEEAFVGGDGKALIATLTFTMTPEERESFLMHEGSIGEAAMDETVEIYDGENYLVAEHTVNSLEVKYTPAVIADINDNIGADDMVTVHGTIEMSARENGDTPIEGNYATLYWRHKGASAYKSLVIESAETDRKVVEYILEDVPADTEIEIYVEKNGYLTGKGSFTFQAKTEDETDEKPVRIAETIVLVAGDIKDNVDDACGNGEINVADFVRVLRGFDENATEEFRNLIDIDESGDVNVTDLAFVKANFGMKAE